MGIIRRPDPVKLEDVDTPVEENIVCIVEESDDGNTVEIICVAEELLEELKAQPILQPVEPIKAEIKPKAVVTSTATGEQFGTWIPVLRSTGTIDVNIRNAFYTKVGQLVTCTFDIVVTNMSGGKKDSPITLQGLPINSIGTLDSMAGSAYISYFKVSNLDVRSISGTINGSDNRVELWCRNRGPGNLVPLTQIDINVNTVLVGTVTYISNS
jgi:hypothetical protein